MVELTDVSVVVVAVCEVAVVVVAVCDVSVLVVTVAVAVVIDVLVNVVVVVVGLHAGPSNPSLHTHSCPLGAATELDGKDAPSSFCQIKSSTTAALTKHFWSAANPQPLPSASSPDPDPDPDPDSWSDWTANVVDRER